MGIYLNFYVYSSVWIIIIFKHFEDPGKRAV